MNHLVKSVLAASLVLAGTGLAAAQSGSPEVGFVDAGYDACFSRSYPPSHLAKHPLQKVSTIALIYKPKRSFNGQRPLKQWDVIDGTPMLFATLAVRVAGRPGALLATVGCKGKSGARTLTCAVDEDGGSFSLKQVENGILLENVDEFRVTPASGNHDRDMAQAVMIDSSDDHRRFMLTATELNPICETKWPSD